MDNWIKWDPKHPPEDDWYLVAIKGYNRAVVAAFDEGEGKWYFEHSEYPLDLRKHKLTHYQPIPDLPTNDLP
ncbi:hypothetical protein Q5H92_14690 [Hymenobacter sp. M29]|uniref:DUF551 domain-containing protein n=1 Tax=Hymenobacter mellowenesis TaxID=3063995 RepID=A0ABT9ACP3_9BACT|nr:hypothetical protein [Hymenobacter sp. M29]MDO7847613.1 hypothetical protein [Hymenobacter sp. M29]